MVVWELLSQHLSVQVVAVLGALYGAWKIRRLRSIAGALVGVAGTTAFAATVLVVGAGVSVAMGWLDLGALVTDAVEIGDTIWSAIGDWLIDQARGVLQ